MEYVLLPYYPTKYRSKRPLNREQSVPEHDLSSPPAPKIPTNTALQKNLSLVSHLALYSDLFFSWGQASVRWLALERTVFVGRVKTPFTRRFGRNAPGQPAGGELLGYGLLGPSHKDIAAWSLIA